jgi:REP-associated tyrosine transposase
MFQDQSRKRRSIRFPGYDYAFRGFFFVTLCTHEKHHSLARIINFESRLSPVGKVVEQCWKEIPQHFPRVRLDEWIIMPNHLHGIIVMRPPIESEGTACRAPTTKAVVSGETPFEEFGRPVAGSLATIIRSYKSAVTRRVNQALGGKALPVWQRNYFEHIIRSQESLNKIRNYIWENPIHWDKDEYNIEGAELGSGRQRHASPK